MQLTTTFKKFLFYIKAFRRLELMNRAASLSYYTVISIFPTIVVTLIISSWFFNPQTLQTEIQTFLQSALPFESDLILQNLHAIFKSKISLSTLSVIMLFVSSQMLYVNLERIINSILHTEQKRHFLIQRLFFFVWLFAMIAVLFAPIVITFSASLLQFLNIPIERSATLLGHASFMISTGIMFVLILLILPTRKLNSKRMALGALAFALTIQLGKLLFKVVMQRNLSRYNLVYGSLSSTMLVMIWIFYFYNVLLFFVYWTGREHDPLFLKNQS